jgi:Uma2 family endonuclease
MTAAQKRHLISVDEYLAGEQRSRIKHEYLGGVVYAMAGGTNAHSTIASNTLGILHNQLRGKPCRALNSDTKIRIHLHTDHYRFYYADASVVCRSNPPGDQFQDQPVVIIEVLSRRTRRADEGEKKDAYLTIPSLSVYVLLEQDMPLAVVFRRTAQGFAREVYEGMEAVIPLPDIAANLPLAETYERIEFTPEPDDDDEA